MLIYRAKKNNQSLLNLNLYKNKHIMQTKSKIYNKQHILLHSNKLGTIHKMTSSKKQTKPQ